jgi:hypothetical protein
MSMTDTTRHCARSRAPWEDRGRIFTGTICGKKVLISHSAHQWTYAEILDGRLCKKCQTILYGHVVQ